MELSSIVDFKTRCEIRLPWQKSWLATLEYISYPIHISSTLTNPFPEIKVNSIEKQTENHYPISFNVIRHRK